eukprot:scaffold791_cov115-Cylindrotheca_fusiformis.AAC.17
MSSDDPKPSLKAIKIKAKVKAKGKDDNTKDDDESSLSSESVGSLDENKLDSMFDADTDSLRLSKGKLTASKRHLNVSEKDEEEEDEEFLSDEDLKTASED